MSIIQSVNNVIITELALTLGYTSMSNICELCELAEDAVMIFPTHRLLSYDKNFDHLHGIAMSFTVLVYATWTQIIIIIISVLIKMMLNGYAAGALYRVSGRS